MEVHIFNVIMSKFMHKSRLILNLLIHISYEVVNGKMNHDRQTIQGTRRDLVVSGIRDQKEALWTRSHVVSSAALWLFSTMGDNFMGVWVVSLQPLTRGPGLGVFVKDILVSWSYLLLSTMNFHLHPKKQNNNNFFWKSYVIGNDRRRV